MAIYVPFLTQLSEQEEEAISRLTLELAYRRFRYDLVNAYYEGEMRIASLGIAIPPQLANLRTIVGWPRVIVDSIDERLDVEGFRYSDGADADTDLWDIWQANDLDLESQLGHLDALVFGRSFVTVGAPDIDGDQPIITVDSPRDLACHYDPRARTILSAFREIRTGIRDRSATLYLPNETISMEFDGAAGWSIVDRNLHGLGQVPVIPMSNRARISERHGRSEITPEVVSLTDGACRTMLSMTVAGEFFAAPQRYILGASESAFQSADGTAKTAWETYLGMVLALENDENGVAPKVGQFTPFDPGAYTKVLDSYAKVMTSITGLPSEYLGITTTNPSSADAIRMNSDRLVNKVKRKQRSFEGAWEAAMRLALLIRDGSVPPEANSMETLWRNPEIPTPSSTAEAIFRQVSGGMIPATSDVTLEHLGYSAVERARLEADREKDAGAQFLAELATSLQAKEARVDKSLAGDINAQALAADGKAAPAVAVPPVPPPKNG